jgi:hypothetical protein
MPQIKAAGAAANWIVAEGTPDQAGLPLKRVPTMVSTVATAMTPPATRLWAANKVAVILLAGLERVLTMEFWASSSGQT